MPKIHGYKPVSLPPSVETDPCPESDITEVDLVCDICGLTEPHHAEWCPYTEEEEK